MSTGEQIEAAKIYTEISDNIEELTKLKEHIAALKNQQALLTQKIGRLDIYRGAMKKI